MNGRALQKKCLEKILKIIRSIKNLSCRYIATEENPADLATHGATFKQLQNNQLR